MLLRLTDRFALALEQSVVEVANFPLLERQDVYEDVERIVKVAVG